MYGVERIGGTENKKKWAVFKMTLQYVSLLGVKETWGDILKVLCILNSVTLTLDNKHGCVK